MVTSSSKIISFFLLSQHTFRFFFLFVLVSCLLLLYLCMLFVDRKLFLHPYTPTPLSPTQMVDVRALRREITAQHILIFPNICRCRRKITRVRMKR